MASTTIGLWLTFFVAVTNEGFVVYQLAQHLFLLTPATVVPLQSFQPFFQLGRFHVLPFQFGADLLHDGLLL